MKKIIIIGFVMSLTGCVTLKPKFHYGSDEKEIKVGVTVGIGKDSLKAWVDAAKGWFQDNQVPETK